MRKDCGPIVIPLADDDEEDRLPACDAPAGDSLFMKNNGTNRQQEIILQAGDPVVMEITKVRREEVLLKAGALQNAIFNSANFSNIATDAGYLLFAGHASDYCRKMDASLWWRRKPA